MRSGGKGLRKENRFQATGPPAMQTVHSDVAIDRSTQTLSDVKKDLPKLLLLYQTNPEEGRDQLIEALNRIQEVEESEKKKKLIDEITHNGSYSKKTNFADIFHSQGTTTPGQDLESLTVDQLENIKNGRVETKKNSEKPWYEKAKDVLETAVVPALGDVAHIFGKVIPGLNLITDKIEEVTNHGVHSWDDLGVFGDIINLAPALASQAIPTNKVSDILEATGGIKNLLGGKVTINPYAIHYRRGRVHKSNRR